MPRNVEQLFGLCRVVSSLCFFKQFNATTTARLCARLVLRPLVRGSRIYLQEDAPQNALHIVLEGNLNQGTWTLQPGDTFGYRMRQVDTYLRPNATTNRCIIAVSDCLIAYLDGGDATDIFNFRSSPKFATICFQPELARVLLRSKTGSRSQEEDTIVLSLVAPLKFMRSLSADMRSASARLMRLSSVFAGHPAFCGTKLHHQLFVVLAGAISASAPKDGTSFAFGTYRQLETSATNERRVLLRPGDSYPPRALEMSTSNPRQKFSKHKTFKSLELTEDGFTRIEAVFTAETYAEVLTLRLDTLMSTIFPSELPYSLELCRRFLRTHPTERTVPDVHSFSIALLRSLPFFLQLPISTCKRLASRMELLCLDENETLMLQPLENYCLVLLNGTMTFDGNQILPGDMIGRDKLLHPWLGGCMSLRTAKACDLAILDERYYRSASHGCFGLWPNNEANSRGPETATPDFQLPIALDASLNVSIVLAVLGLHKCQGVSPSATLIALPRCLRLRLAKTCAVERRGAYVDLGPLDDFFAVVVRGSISIHCSCTRLVDDETPGHDDAECFIRPNFQRSNITRSMETQKSHRIKMTQNRNESPTTSATTALEQLASLNDHESSDMRHLWHQLELGECCAIVTEGGDVGLEHPDCILNPGEAKLARIVTREPTTFVRVDVSASTSYLSGETMKQGRAVHKLMENLIHRGADLQSKPTVELVLEVLCLEPCLAALPPRLRLHLARATTIRTVQQDTELVSAQSQKNRDGECCFVLEGTLEVLALLNEPILLDRKLAQRTGIFQGRVRMGDLVPGDIFGGDEVIKLAVVIADTHRDAMMCRNCNRLSPELTAQDAFSATDAAFAAVSALAAQKNSNSMPLVEAREPPEKTDVNGGRASLSRPISTFAMPPVVFKCASQTKLLVFGVKELLDALAVMSREDAARLKQTSIPRPPTETRLIAPLLERAEFNSLKRIESYNQDNNRSEVTASMQNKISTSTSPVHQLLSNSDNDDTSVTNFVTDSTLANAEWGGITQGLPPPITKWHLRASKMALPRRPETSRAASVRNEALRIRKLINSPPILKSLPDGRRIHQAKMFFRDFPRKMGNQLLKKPVSISYKPALSDHCKYTRDSNVRYSPKPSNNPVSKASTPRDSHFSSSSRAKTVHRSKARSHKHVILSASGDSAILRPLIPAPPVHGRILSREGPWKQRASTGERAFFKAASGRIRPLHLLADRADWAVEGAIRNMHGLL